MTWTLTEGCACTAALTMHYAGAKAVLVPVMGNKWKHRKALVEIIESAGFKGPPSAVNLIDPGPWGRTHKAIWRKPTEISELVQTLAQQDPKDLYESLHRHKVPWGPRAYASEHLVLQRLTYGGKPVRDVDGVWVSQGRCQVSSYGQAAKKGIPGKKDVGKFNPLLPCLVRRLSALSALAIPQVQAFQTSLIRWMKEDAVGFGDVLVIDPPYQNTTGYGHLFPREDVVACAIVASDENTLVLVCEAEPIAALVALGWTSVEVTKFTGNSPLKGGHKHEFVTHNANLLTS